MKDVCLLALPIFVGWLVFLPLEAWFGIDADVRWNHPLVTANPRRFRAPACEALEDLESFEWEWGCVVAAISKQKEREMANG